MMTSEWRPRKANNSSRLALPLTRSRVWSAATDRNVSRLGSNCSARCTGGGGWTGIRVVRTPAFGVSLMAMSASPCSEFRCVEKKGGGARVSFFFFVINKKKILNHHYFFIIIIINIFA